MKAVVVDPASPGRLVLHNVNTPTPAHNAALVRVHAVSLNRGEVRMSLNSSPADHRPGWDLAGVVEAPAADGSGPKAGARVVGIVRSGAWAERAVVPTEFLAELPDAVSFAQAATLPVAGLTALHALYKGGTLLGKSVLVTGATGGVGDFAMQIARHSGARVTAHVRRPEQADFVRASGAHNVAIGENLGAAARELAPFDLVVESVGGAVLGAALPLLAERGTCVLFGTSAGSATTFDAAKFYSIGGTTLYGMFLFDELKWVEPATIGLSKLAALVAEGVLKPQISVERPWTEIAQVARDLQDRRFPGKAVLKVGE